MAVQKKKKTAARKPTPSAKPTGSKKRAAKKQNAAKQKPAATTKASMRSSSSSVGRRIEERIAQLGDWRGERLAEVRALIRKADPDVIEEWKWRGTPVWSHQGMFVLADAFKDKVKITFLHGAQLPDPKKIFNNGLDGNKWRAIDLRAGDKLNKAAFTALLHAAMAYNRSHNVPKSKGSRV